MIVGIVAVVYDRLVHLWDLPTSESHPELLDLVRVYGYDDVEFMLNVIKEDLESALMNIASSTSQRGARTDEQLD